MARKDKNVVKLSSFYQPFPRQAEFHANPAKYRLFGGAAGPGKSYALLWEAIMQCLEVPGANCLLLRRTYPRLQQGLIDHFLKYIPIEIYGGARNYNQTDHIVKFPNKSTLRFGHCQHEADVRNYQGGEYLFIGFDELTEFTYPMWSFMTSRNRCPVPGSFPNMAGATNPGGVGHAWVKALWLDRKPVPGQDAATYRAADYDFIRARVTDNPVYANDPNYMATLNTLPKGLRDAMLDGSWDVFAGQYFDNFDKTENVVSREMVERIIRPWWPRWISHDWGYAHHSPVLWHARGEHEGRDVVVTYRELVLNQMGERQLGEEIAYRTRDEKLERYFLSPDAFAKRTSANTIAHELGEAVARRGIPRPDAADNDRVGGWRLMHEKLGNRTWLISEDCPQLINALPLLVRDEKNLEDVAKVDTLEDDVADCARYGLKSMLSPNQKPRNVVLAELLDPIPDYQQKAMAHRFFEKNNKPKNKAFFIKRGHRIGHA